MALRDVIGQDRAVKILLSTISRGRLPSAYIFCGEAGIGKRFTATNLAKAINCLKNRDALSVRPAPKGNTHYAHYDFDACDGCVSCKKIASATHPDFVVITPEKGEIRVDGIRAVEDALSFKPYEGKKKVVIIDDADTMNSSAANAFLKTLEEPPDESLLILVTSSPDRLPETIRSRCARINFVPLSPEACKRVIEAERPEMQDSEMSAIVRLCMGRPGLAISADILKERERFIGLLRNMGTPRSLADRDEMDQWLDMALLFLRDMAVLRITGDGGLLLNTDRVGLISDIAKNTDIKGIIESYHKVGLLIRQLDFNLNKAITWNYVSNIIQNLLYTATCSITK